ncbi:uncharacterized protein SPSK_04703 [Sporothrix schenckii 1099-18]|uniref:Uncharacterized protein n=1 Tax=Sporothrix schenckii 1099-18 TaxID=1397361 RepID=A0A0F2M1C0_SPOSC|nr:uncharacterized protein SPSK_04703 [Sporothrix schenckii 1099-18]KJR83488.1 hypothetical protein SPSK_04703 [Sporothrix schenckii 1099-18]
MEMRHWLLLATLESGHIGPLVVALVRLLFFFSLPSDCFFGSFSVVWNTSRNGRNAEEFEMFKGLGLRGVWRDGGWGPGAKGHARTHACTDAPAEADNPPWRMLRC